MIFFSAYIYTCDVLTNHGLVSVEDSQITMNNGVENNDKDPETNNVAEQSR